LIARRAAAATPVEEVAEAPAPKAVEKKVDVVTPAPKTVTKTKTRAVKKATKTKTTTSHNS